jgi:predicted ATPase
MDAPWRIRLLGALRVEMGETTISRFATSRVAVLLARLALYPQRAHSREELCDLLWPEAGLSAGRLSLRVAIASLRRQLEPPPLPPGSVLFADRSFVGINPAAFRCDVADFEAAWTRVARAPSAPAKREALDQAMALYGGDLLPGFYDDWIAEERERLAALHEEICAQGKDLAARMPVGRSSVIEAEAAAERAAPAPRLVCLPLQFTRFFGREPDCAHLAELLGMPSTRLVTLTGSGGSGKTRLALEAARQITDHAGSRFAGPVCFVPLADLSDARLIPAAMAEALALTREGDAEPLDLIVAALAKLPPALLLLDNFEHLVERGAPLVLSLLTRLPTLTCLVTSRRRLGLPGEREYPVPPLAVPPLALPDAHETPALVAQAAGVQLFVDRAQAARPDFQLTRGNVAAVAALCRNLEGIPLAIELVAARAMALTPAQMNERLAQRFELLTSRRWDEDGRHRSLWVALAWSYDLIPPPLQRFFASLSVFRGGCTVEAAQSVCEEPLALEFLTQLRERSLLTVEHDGAEPRFRLMETLREFAGEQLSERDRARLRARHGEWFLGLAEASRAALRGPEQARWLERLGADEDNLRAALDAMHESVDRVESELRLVGALVQFWAMRGGLQEGRGRIEDALARGADAPARLRAAALHGACFLAYWQADYPATQVYSEAALNLWHTTDDKVGPLAVVQISLALTALDQEEWETARALLAERLAFSRETGEERDTGIALRGLGRLALR